MDLETDSPFIFYLTLDDKLPKSYYVFHETLKDFGCMLVPVGADQLQLLLASSGQTQIIVLTCVTDARELKLYNTKIRGLLKYILKSKRLTFLHLSSFSKHNDVRYTQNTKNYYSLKFPLDAHKLSGNILRFYELKSKISTKWPGGRRAGLGAVV